MASNSIDVGCKKVQHGDLFPKHFSVNFCLGKVFLNFCFFQSVWGFVYGLQS